MKKVINGKMYNTQTAECYGEYQYSNCGDFQYVYEALYRKKTGEMFLYGTGGPASKYREKVGSSTWTGGTQIIPLTVDEAKEWAEKYIDGGTYVELFGEVEE